VAEHVGFGFGVGVAADEVKLVGDCAAVVQGWHRGYRWATQWNRPQAGLWREIHQAGARKNVKDVGKVKAHRTVEEAQGADDRRWIIGNSMADSWAEKGARLHGESCTRKLELSRKCNKVAGIAIAKMLGKWPHARELWPDAQKVVAEAAARGQKRKETVRPHEWSWTGSAWRCKECLRQTKTRNADKECNEVPPSLKRALEGGLAHNLYACRTESGLWCFWCNKCFGWCEQRSRKLQQSCKGIPTNAGRQVEKSVGRLKHPRNGEALGIPVPFQQYVDSAE
jgi:hypothetical protein